MTFIAKYPGVAFLIGNGVLAATAVIEYLEGVPLAVNLVTILIMGVIFNSITFAAWWKWGRGAGPRPATRSVLWALVLVGGICLLGVYVVGRSVGARFGVDTPIIAVTFIGFAIWGLVKGSPGSRGQG